MNRAAVGNPFTAFRHRSFLCYWIGMFVSATGSWMQNVAQPLLAYKLTNSPFLLGLVSALQFLPVLLLSLFAGVAIDRFDKKKILYIMQGTSLLVTLALAALTFSGRIAFWHLIVSSTVLGIASSFDVPTRQSLIIELVGKEDLTNGIALNSMQFNLARIIGPAIAALIIGSGPNGGAVCFLLNAVSFGIFLLSLVFIHPNKVEKAPAKETGVLSNIAEGVKFVSGIKVLSVTLALLAISGTFASNLGVIVPVFSDHVLHQKESGFGILMSMAGVGAFAGALVLASLSKGGPKKFFLFGFPVIVAVLMLLAGFTNIYLLTGIVLALISFFQMIFMSSANSTLQLNTTNEYRGRVNSLYSLVFSGTTPLGNLFAGGIAERFGADVSFIACGAVMLVLLLPLYLILRRHRPEKAP